MLALLLIATLQSPQAYFWYDTLLAQGGYGRMPHERAAFLIREDDGTLTLAPWPNGNGHRHATFRGAVPARAIAILHTHPRDERRPSARDRAEARRLGVAVVVITPDGAIAVLPGGEELAIRLDKLTDETCFPPPRTDGPTRAGGEAPGESAGISVR